MDHHEMKDNRPTMAQPLPTTVKGMRVGLFRAAIFAIVSAMVLMVFVYWYKYWPQQMDCRTGISRIADKLYDYAQTHQRLPMVLEELDVNPGRYDLSHYTYRFMGFGGLPVQPNGTIIIHCNQVHKGMFREPGRHQIMVQNGSFVTQWVSQEQFDEIMTTQDEPRKY